MFLIGASIGCARSDPPRHQLISIQDSREVSAQSGCFAFNHCHAVVNWPGLMIGSYTSLYVAPMYDNHDINSFINNEMWLIDSTTQSCRSSPTLDCLVEAGYQASQGGVHYFVEEHFTDHRLFHAMGYIPTDGTGDFGSNATILLEQASYGQYYIEVRNPHRYISGYSAVSMTPEHIDIGQEISSDTSGIFANPASWNRNIYIQDYQNHYQTSDGSGIPIDPPSRAYWQPPASQSSTGGTWIACTTGC